MTNAQSGAYAVCLVCTLRTSRGLVPSPRFLSQGRVSLGVARPQPVSLVGKGRALFARPPAPTRIGLDQTLAAKERSRILLAWSGPLLDTERWMPFRGSNSDCRQRPNQLL